MDQLGRLAALGKADGPQTSADEARQEQRRLAERARPLAEVRVEKRRVPERDRPFRARRRVVLHDRRVLARKRMRELTRIRDRRGGEQELRLGSVDPREPTQPAQDVRDVRAEDTAIDVRLVDDDELEVVQEVAPEVVPRQDSDVEHVRVRQHEIRPAPDLTAAFGRRVSVVDRGADGRQPELAERTRLILRERFRRIEVEGTRVPVVGERVEDGQVECERLARGGARRDDDVAPALRRGVRLGLVPVELVDTASGEGLPQGRLNGVGERSGSRFACRLARQVG